jgi:hypothetical protein
VDDEKLEAAKELAWVQRDRLNELADCLENQLDQNARAPSGDGTGTWVYALRHIVGSTEETDAFLENLAGLLQHIKLYVASRP